MTKVPIPQLPLVTFQPRSDSQKEFLKILKDNQITLAIGQAGCGKTFASVAYALTKYYEGAYKQIVLVRPLIINEEVGFLKGSLEEKIAPYYFLFEYIIDALVGKTEREQLYKSGAITNLSLGFCRGITSP
jgi:phosphate starvation-inducible PhoH-like protein